MDRKMTPTDQVRIRSLRLANRRFRPNVIRVMTMKSAILPLRLTATLSNLAK